MGKLKKILTGEFIRRRLKRKERIKIICSNTGWSKEKADSELKRAFQLGISNIDYVNYKAWNFGEEEFMAFAENLKEKAFRRNQRIEIICSETGWNKLRADIEMKKAYLQYDIINADYVKYQVWKLNKDEIKETISKIQENLKERDIRWENYIDMVIESTGWSREKALDEMNRARAIGISYRIYARKFVFDLDEKERREFAKLSAKRRRNLKESKDYYVDLVTKRTNWNKYMAEEEMEKLKKQGVSYFNYVRRGYYNQNEKNIQELLELNEDVRDDIAEKREKYIDSIMENTGWSRGKVELEVLRARINHGANYEDYCMHEFYNLTDEQQSKYITLDKLSNLRRKSNDISKAYIFDDKAKFNEVFNDFINRVWFLNEDLSYNDFIDKIKGLNKIIIKPLSASYGRGIEVFKCNESEEKNKELYEYIMNLNRSIVEEYIVQHKEIKSFSKASVNTIRITTLNDNGKCQVLYAILRIGAEGVVDNFQAGGVAARVNPKTGQIYTNAVNFEGTEYEKTPSTDKVIKGVQIPNWDKLLDCCEKMNGMIEDVDYVCWDFAITEDGVDLVEGNINGTMKLLNYLPNPDNQYRLDDPLLAKYFNQAN